jgi:DNA helicase II / ATP-dependent DNA helicase PcrA
MIPSVKPPAWFTKELSPEQQEALNKAVGTSAILASAGSGKTRTLVYAVIDEIKRGTPPSSIIAFTFTKKAAEELLARIHTLAKRIVPDIDCSGIWIGTIHAWCFEFLLQQPSFYNFEPLDEDIQVYAFASRLHDNLNLATVYGRPFPKGIKPFLADLEIYYNESVQPALVPPNIRPSIEGFEQHLRQNRLLTFGAMVQNAARLLEQSGPVATIKKLFVDEYQDVNPAQVRLIHAMLPKEASLVVVGDDLQCIYNWRGSDVTRILNFSKEFDPAVTSTLQENYRSRPRLVWFCNSISDNILNRHPKDMKPVREDSNASGVFHLSFADEDAQAEAVARAVQQLHANGTPYSSIGVLLRSVRGAGRPILDAFKRSAIPVLCPLQRDAGSFLDEFLMPILGWLQDEHNPPINEEEEARVIQQTEKLWNSVQPWLRGHAANPETFWGRLHEWGDALVRNDSAAYNVRGCLYDFLLFCGIGVDKDSTQLSIALGISTQIIRAVEEIHRRRIVGSPRKSARNVVREIVYALRENADELGESIPIDADVNAVVLTTVHQSKGLEWPVVFLPTLNRRRFPLTPRGHGTSFPDEIAARYGTTTEDEWRLFYVAASRAKERLFLFDFANGDSDKQSPFLNALHTAIQTNTPLNHTAFDKDVMTLTPDELKGTGDLPVRVGLSDLLIYVECPFQFALRRLIGIQPAIADDLGYGKGIHEVAQRRSNHDTPWTETEIANQVDTNVHLPYVGEKQLEASKDAIRKRISSLQKVGAFDGKSVPEMKVEVSFDAGIVHGVIDSVLETKKGVIVRDWKTNVHEDFVERYGDQLRFYVHALTLRKQSVTDCELVDVGATHKNGELRKFSLDSTPAAVQNTLLKLDSGMKGIQLHNFNAKPSSQACAVCDMSRICAYRVPSDE